MLSHLKNLQHGQWNLYFGHRPVTLHAMISNCGYTRERSHSYDWHGIKRGKVPFSLIQYTLEGKGKLRFENRHYDLTPGKTMLLSFPHDNRYWLPRDSNFWEFMYVVLYGAEINRIWQTIISRTGPVVDLSQDSSTVSMMAKIINHSREGTIQSSFMASQYAYSLAMKLSFSLLGHAKPGDHERPEAVTRAIDFCKENLERPIGVDDMALAAGYSRYHFTRLFLASEGVSPGRFLKSQRIQLAAALLHTTRLTVQQVADQTGFFDATYFCKAFRKSMGVAPRAFRVSGMYGMKAEVSSQRAEGRGEKAVPRDKG